MGMSKVTTGNVKKIHQANTNYSRPIPSFLLSSERHYDIQIQGLMLVVVYKCQVCVCVCDSGNGGSNKERLIKDRAGMNVIPDGSGIIGSPPGLESKRRKAAAMTKEVNEPPRHLRGVKGSGT